MPTITHVMTYTPDLLGNIMDDIEGQTAKDTVAQIINCFSAKGFPIKAQYIIRGESNSYYRVLCFAGKSKETVNVNTKNAHGPDGVAIKIRIENQDTLDRLDEFTDNIRDQILNAIDCHYCGPNCEGKRYIFAYQDKEYVKCQYLGCNFRFSKINECDIPSILDIVNSEFSQKKR